MAYFAKIGSNNLVEQVIVVNDNEAPTEQDGINYINNPEIKKEFNSSREYELKLPIPKITQVKEDGTKKTFKRLFKKSKHIGYGLSDL